MMSKCSSEIGRSFDAKDIKLTWVEGQRGKGSMNGCDRVEEVVKAGAYKILGSIKVSSSSSSFL